MTLSYLLVETYQSGPMSGHRGEVRVRAVKGQLIEGHPVDPKLYVRALKAMRTNFEPGSRFLVRAKLSTRLGSGPYVNTSNWDPVWQVTKDEAAKFLRTRSLPPWLKEP